MRHLILPLMLVAVACQSARVELTEAQKAAIADTVSALHAEWRGAVQADFSRAMSYYLDSPEFTLVYGTELIRGLARLETSVDPTAAMRQSITLWESQTTVLAPDVARVIEIGTASITYASGVTGPDIRFASTHIWIRTETGWRISSGHVSIGEPPSR